MIGGNHFASGIAQPKCDRIWPSKVVVASIVQRVRTSEDVHHHVIVPGKRVALRRHHWLPQSSPQQGCHSPRQTNLRPILNPRTTRGFPSQNVQYSTVVHMYEKAKKKSGRAWQRRQTEIRNMLTYPHMNSIVFIFSKRNTKDTSRPFWPRHDPSVSQGMMQYHRDCEDHWMLSDGE